MLLIAAHAYAETQNESQAQVEQAQRPQGDRRLTDLPDAVIIKLAELARENLSLAKLPDGSPMPLETPEERKKPIVPLEVERRTVDRGMVSAQAEWCGLDWQKRSFLPFMETEHNLDIWSGKQISYIGLLHGISQGVYLRSLKEKNKPCGEADKQKIARFLAPE